MRKLLRYINPVTVTLAVMMILAVWGTVRAFGKFDQRFGKTFRHKKEEPKEGPSVADRAGKAAGKAVDPATYTPAPSPTPPEVLRSYIETGKEREWLTAASDGTRRYYRTGHLCQAGVVLSGDEHHIRCLDSNGKPVFLYFGVPGPLVVATPAPEPTPQLPIIAVQASQSLTTPLSGHGRKIGR